MRTKHQIILFFLALTLGCCTSGKSQLTASDTTGNKKKFKEDLSEVRVKYNVKEDTVKTPLNNNSGKPVVPTKDIGRALNAKMDSIAQRNTRLRFAEGYRIQVYSGDKREDAQKARSKVYDLDSDLNVYEEFRSPVFRVRAGDFLDRLEANFVLVKLQKEFPNAMIVPDKIKIIKQ